MTQIDAEHTTDRFTPGGWRNADDALVDAERALKIAYAAADAEIDRGEERDDLLQEADRLERFIAETAPAGHRGVAVKVRVLFSESYEHLMPGFDEFEGSMRQVLEFLEQFGADERR